MKYEISVAADADLDEIWRYTDENWSLSQAIKYYDLIMDMIEELAISPGLGRSVSYGGKSFKWFPVESHLIFYNKTTDNQIEVIRILHKRMNVKDRLSE